MVTTVLEMTVWTLFGVEWSWAALFASPGLKRCAAGFLDALLVRFRLQSTELTASSDHSEFESVVAGQGKPATGKSPRSRAISS